MPRRPLPQWIACEATEGRKGWEVRSAEGELIIFGLREADAILIAAAPRLADFLLKLARGSGPAQIPAETVAKSCKIFDTYLNSLEIQALHNV